MKLQNKLIFILFILIFISFITYGSDTKYILPPADKLILGKTTYDQVLNMLGIVEIKDEDMDKKNLLKEMKKGFDIKKDTNIINEKAITKIEYSDINAGFEQPALKGKGIWPVRVLYFYFLDNILVGVEFISSCKKDSTFFDESKITQIKENQSTKKQVIELLGEPYGKYIYPMIKNKNEKAIVFSYMHIYDIKMYERPKFYTRNLIVAYNNNEIITNVVFTKSEEK